MIVFKDRRLPLSEVVNNVSIEYLWISLADSSPFSRDLKIRHGKSRTESAHFRSGGAEVRTAVWRDGSSYLHLGNGKAGLFWDSSSMWRKLTEQCFSGRATGSVKLQESCRLYFIITHPFAWLFCFWKVVLHADSWINVLWDCRICYQDWGNPGTGLNNMISQTR